MITYVDTSTLIKLFISEPGSDRAAAIWDASDVVASATLVIVEARAALAAAHKGARLGTVQYRSAKGTLAERVDELALVQVTEDLIMVAADLAESEGLRGYDAVHLAAAVILGAEVFTSADEALCAAATRRGFHVSNPLEAST